VHVIVPAADRRFARMGINLLHDSPWAESSAVTNDTPAAGRCQRSQSAVTRSQQKLYPGMRLRHITNLCSLVDVVYSRLIQSGRPADLYAVGVGSRLNFQADFRMSFYRKQIALALWR
jgi:hypothetical protein